MIIQDDEVFEVPSGVKTLGDNDLIIKPTSDGNYQIIARGAGVTPKEFATQKFTTLIHAKRAISRYLNKHATQFRKKEIMREGIERRQAALELKNGELTSTVNNGEDLGSRKHEQTLPKL